MKEKIFSLIHDNKRILPGVAIIGALAFILIIKWGYNHHQRSIDEISAYNDLLQTSAAIIERGDDVKKSITLKKEEISKLEKGLLKAEKPSIAAAELQEAFKKMAAKKDITINSENVLNFEETGEYVRIPVEFHLKAKLRQLTLLLYDIKLSPLLMSVRSMNIRTINARDNAEMNITIVLEGAIKNKGVVI
ncbi:MAG: type II secretion system protein GspM [Thermodesulfobacteriota bacterium]